LGEMIMKAKEKLTFRECVYGNLMCFDGNLILIFFTISLPSLTWLLSRIRAIAGCPVWDE
jgi:hypothetical protein